MMQLGFGLSAAQSGLITLGTALGSLVMKSVAPRILRRFGFRDSLMVGGFIACGLYGLCALFRPGWPLPLIFAILVACGFFMSFQFTAYNTVAYDRIPPERLAVATSFYTTFQQLMLSVGICIGAMGLEGAMALRHHADPTSTGFPRWPGSLVCRAFPSPPFSGNPALFAVRRKSSSAAIPRAPGRCARRCGICGGSIPRTSLAANNLWAVADECPLCARSRCSQCATDD